ncbi:MAG: sulfotransferase [Paracoccaceae bacterium]
MKKLFLCVGAAKTGTTWLYRNLEAHPDLWFTPEKELNYFFSKYGAFNRLTPLARNRKLEIMRAMRDDPDRKLDAAEQKFVWFAQQDEGAAAIHWYERFASGRITDHWYRGLFAGMPEGAWACDFSPSTSLTPAETWPRIAHFADEVRIVYILREPCERLWSHAKFHARFIGKLDEFAAMGADEVKAFVDQFKLAGDGDYGAHLARIYAAIPRKNVLVIDYRDISNRPEKALRRVEAHLGLSRGARRPDLMTGRINPSDEIARPEWFCGAYGERFAEDANLLLDQGVRFARPWARRYGRRVGWRRRLRQELRF